MKLRVLELFAGIGGFTVGLERAGIKTVGFCEIEDYPRKVLKKRCPNVPQIDDIRALNAFLKRRCPPRSLPAAFRARISALRARARASTAPVPASGPKCGEPLAWYDPKSSSWKTFQRCFLETAEGGFSAWRGTWPRSGMISNGIAYRLPTLALPTGATASGSLPTPRSCSGLRSSGMNRTELLRATEFFPTPTAPYGTGQNGERGDGTTFKGAGAPSLDTMARHNLWPTPSANDGNGGKGIRKGATRTGRLPDGRKAQIDLPTAVKMETFPTPRASDADRGGRGELLHQVKGGTPRGELWPTPTWRDSRDRTYYGGGDLALSGAVKAWPTPASRDYRHPNKSPYSRRGGGKKGEQLPNAVGGQLNPKWVEWLMAFPLGWTDLRASVTPWSRSSRKSSAGSS